MHFVLTVVMPSVATFMSAVVGLELTVRDFPQAKNYMTAPSRTACNACHDDVNFATGANHVSPDTKSFTDALRAALREDPDVVLIGEMRISLRVSRPSSPGRGSGAFAAGV